jgi:hypothetical protein
MKQGLYKEEGAIKKQLTRNYQAITLQLCGNLFLAIDHQPLNILSAIWRNNLHIIDTRRQ